MCPRCPLAPGMFCYTFELDRLIADMCYFVDQEEVSTRVRNQAYELLLCLDHACQTGDGLLDFERQPQASLTTKPADTPQTNPALDPCARPRSTLPAFRRRFREPTNLQLTLFRESESSEIIVVTRCRATTLVSRHFF